MTLAITASNITKSSNTISLYRAQSKDLQLNVMQQSAATNNVPEPLDLTGATLYFTVRLVASDPKALIVKTSSDPTQITINTPAKAGIAVIHIQSSDTSFLDPQIYLFDIWVRLFSGKQYPLVPVADFELLQPVTQLQ